MTLSKNYLYKPIIDFRLSTPGRSISFQSKKYSKLIKTISLWEHKKPNQMYSGDVPKKELFSLVPRLGF